MKIYSALEISLEIGCDRGTVIRTAQSAGLGQRVGRQTVFSDREKKLLKKTIIPKPRKILGKTAKI
jgi:hypothetical protein